MIVPVGDKNCFLGVKKEILAITTVCEPPKLYPSQEMSLIFLIRDNLHFKVGFLFFGSDNSF